MKAVLALIQSCGLMMASPYTHADSTDSTKITDPVWTIVVTITDKATGKRLDEGELDPGLRFADRSQCESILAKVSPLFDRRSFASALTCRKVTPV
jgi:hypothetical protein